MKQVQVVATCDKCGGANADEYTEENSKGKLVVLDLDKPCHDWREELRQKAELILAPLVTLADEKGVTPDKAKAQTKPQTKPKAITPPSERPGNRVCLVCPATRTSNTGILNHMQDAHGFPHSIPKIYGNVCPLDGEIQDGLARHVGQLHKEFAHITEAFVWAKENGDPHGIVAARIAALQSA